MGKRSPTSERGAKSNTIVRYFSLAILGMTTVVVLNDFALAMNVRRKLCRVSGELPRGRRLAAEPQILPSAIISYIDNLINGDEDPCKTDFPDEGVFEEYPPVVYDGGDGIPQRPPGTVAYVLPINGCPNRYEPGVIETPDPGADLFEVTAIIKDEICNATETMNRISADTGSPYAKSQTLYALVNPNGVTCNIPGSNEQYDRVAMLQDMGYRVEILGQPIVNSDLVEHQPYISENLEADVGIRDYTKLRAFAMTEHPVVVLYNYDVVFQYRIMEVIDALDADPNLKGYYVRKAACDEEGSTIVDTGFMVIKPSIEEYEKIIATYLSTPYDEVDGWNSEGHNKCDGKLGLPGFFSWYFSNNPEYEELDRCTYSFVADDECISQNVQADANTALDIVNSVSANSTYTATTPEGAVAMASVQDLSAPVDEVRILPLDENHAELSAELVQEESLMIVEVYVQVMVSVKMMVRTINSDGEVTYNMVMSNSYQTEKRMVEMVAMDPSLIQAPEIIEDPVADAFVGAAVTRPVVARQSTEICGKPTDCPADDPNWYRSQQLACQELHSNHFMDRRRTELTMGIISLSDLIGQFKPRSFHGYCTGEGPENYIGLKDKEPVKAPEWQTVCEPMVCPYGSYVTPECTCSVLADPCDSCPSGTRCQRYPQLLCIDCQCGVCGGSNDSCCET